MLHAADLPRRGASTALLKSESEVVSSVEFLRPRQCSEARFQEITWLKCEASKASKVLTANVRNSNFNLRCSPTFYVPASYKTSHCGQTCTQEQYAPFCRKRDNMHPSNSIYLRNGLLLPQR